MTFKRNPLIFFCIFILFFISAHQAFADSKQRIFDEAELLTKDQIASLESDAEKTSHKHETDVIILTTDGEHGIDLEQFMADFADEHKLGYDREKGNAIILGIDLKQSYVEIMKFGETKEKINYDRTEQMLDKITPHLSNGEFVKAFEKFISTADRYMKFKPGVNPDHVMFYTSVQILLALLLGALITYFMVRTSIPRKTVTESTYRNAQLTKILHQRDRYMRKSVTRSYRPRHKERSSRRGVRTSRKTGRTKSGRTYTSSRRKF